MNDMDFIYDFVVCIEATKDFKPTACRVASALKRFFEELRDEAEASGKTPKLTRVKFIFFDDVAWCKRPFTESPFFDLDDVFTTDTIEASIKSVEYEDGHGYCNAGEALALALKSPFHDNGYVRRTILLFSGSEVRPIGGNQTLIQTYPADMPKDEAELYRWCDGDIPFHGSTGKPKLIFCFCPENRLPAPDILSATGSFSFGTADDFADYNPSEISTIIKYIVHNDF